MLKMTMVENSTKNSWLIRAEILDLIVYLVIVMHYLQAICNEVFSRPAPAYDVLSVVYKAV